MPDDGPDTEPQHGGGAGPRSGGSSRGPSRRTRFDDEPAAADKEQGAEEEQQPPSFLWDAKEVAPPEAKPGRVVRPAGGPDGSTELAEVRPGEPHDTFQDIHLGEIEVEEVDFREFMRSPESSRDAARDVGAEERKPSRSPLGDAAGDLSAAAQAGAPAGARPAESSGAVEGGPAGGTGVGEADLGGGPRPAKTTPDTPPERAGADAERPSGGAPTVTPEAPAGPSVPGPAEVNPPGWGGPSGPPEPRPAPPHSDVDPSEPTLLMRESEPSGKDSTGPTVLMPGRGGAAPGPARQAGDPMSNTLLAQFVFKKGFASPSEVRTCLADLAKAQEQGIPKTLAEILVEKGILSEEQLQPVLGGGEVQPPPAPEAEPREARENMLGENYELLEKIGEGGMGAVYKARQIALDRIVALKILTDRLASNTEFVSRFEREARAAGKLDHPNVVRAIDAGKAGGKYYFAMEFVEGQSFEDMLEKRCRIPEEEAIGIAVQAARGIECAWRNQLVHRDIKPDNIVITEEGVVKILDLGLAREAETAEATRLTQDGAAMGTPHYISPEQARGEDVDIRTDIYALGVTLYRTVTGEFPFKGKDPLSIITARFHETPRAPNEVNPEVSEEMALVIATMMSPDREFRYPDPAVLLHDLELLAEGKEPEFAGASETSRLRAITAAAKRMDTTTFGAIVIRRRRKRELALASVGLLVIAAAAIAGLFLFKDRLFGTPPGPEGPTPEELARLEAERVLEAEAKELYEAASADFEAKKYPEVVYKVDEVGDKYAETAYGRKLDSLRTRAAAEIEQDERRRREEAERAAKLERDYRNFVKLVREYLALGDYVAALGYLNQAKEIKNTEEVQGLFQEVDRLRYLALARKAEQEGKLAEAVGLYRRALEIKDDPEVRAHVAELERRLAFLAKLKEADELKAAASWREAKAAYDDALEIAKGDEVDQIRQHLAVVEPEVRYLDLIEAARAAARAAEWKYVLTTAREAEALKPDAQEPRDLIVLARRALGPEKEITGPFGMVFVLVPAGEFVMGSDEGAADEAPAHTVYLDAYYVSRFEVTNSQFEKFDSTHRRTEFSPADEGPVVAVSWRDGAAFCRWLSEREGVGYRLPTEAEWERAARYGRGGPSPDEAASVRGGGKFPWGDEEPGAGGTWRCNLAPAKEQDRWAEDGHKYASEVGAYPGGASALGVHDLAGNVWEWCLDRYGKGYYEKSGDRNPKGPLEGDRYVLRGGSFANAASAARSANRASGEPGLVEGCVGFRCARSLDTIFVQPSASPAAAGGLGTVEPSSEPRGGGE